MLPILGRPTIITRHFVREILCFTEFIQYLANLPLPVIELPMLDVPFLAPHFFTDAAGTQSLNPLRALLDAHIGYCVIIS